MFADVFAALKPGGGFGVEQHRAASTGLQDPLAGAGYVQEAYVKALAQEAGFEFVAASGINANPRDTRDHPFGVWTLPPTLRSSPLGEPDDPGFDTRPYVSIGESDRMTLRFRKPSAAAPHLSPIREAKSGAQSHSRLCLWAPDADFVVSRWPLRAAQRWCVRAYSNRGEVP